MSNTDTISFAFVMVVLFASLAVLLVALCAASGAASGDALDEANGVEHKKKPTVRPAPMADGKLCAWCHPGIDWPTGHGICPEHKAEELEKFKRAMAEDALSAARENQMEGGA